MGNKSRSFGKDLVVWIVVCFCNIVKGCIEQQPADDEDGINDK